LSRPWLGEQPQDALAQVGAADGRDRPGRGVPARPGRAALAEQVRLAVDQGATLQLAVEVTAEGLADLPAEALVLLELAVGPLALHPDS
jgi:hypothetical protein